MEAVQEFQVTSGGIRADDGRTGGGVFRYEMKSGTNAWHGSGFYYMHNEALDARSFNDKYNDGLCLQNASGNPAQVASCERAFGKPQDRLYDYGVSFGGPISAISFSSFPHLSGTRSPTLASALCRRRSRRWPFSTAISAPC